MDWYSSILILRDSYTSVPASNPESSYFEGRITDLDCSHIFLYLVANQLYKHLAK
jgi:hypothetical protein